MPPGPFCKHMQKYITSNTVTKLRASDGANLGSFSVGSHPHSVAFDGANIWAANEQSGNVTELRASDGATLGTFPAGSGPEGVAFDGVNIWQRTRAVTVLPNFVQAMART
jgi:DNA-binding beta-propeller fold protein YncE